MFKLGHVITKIRRTLNIFIAQHSQVCFNVVGYMEVQCVVIYLVSYKTRAKPFTCCQLHVCLLCCPSLCRTRIQIIPKRTYRTLHIRLQLKTDPLAGSLATWQLFRPPSFRMLEHKMYFTSDLNLCVFTVQRAVSLFSLSEPHVRGAELRPVRSPVPFHTPQTTRTTPTISR